MIYEEEREREKNITVYYSQLYTLNWINRRRKKEKLIGFQLGETEVNDGSIYVRSTTKKKRWWRIDYWDSSSRCLFEYQYEDRIADGE